MNDKQKLNPLILLPTLLLTLLLSACGSSQLVQPVEETVTPTITTTEAVEPTPVPLNSVDKESILTNYTFSNPQEIIETDFFRGVKTIQWLPDSQTHLLVSSSHNIAILDLTTNTYTFYETLTPPETINGDPVWLPSVNGIAYVVSLPGQTELRLSTSQQNTRILLTDVVPPVIVMPNQKGLVIYHQPTEAFVALSLDGKMRPTQANLYAQLPFTLPNSLGSQYRVAYQPTGDWIAYYRLHGFYLFNQTSGELQEIELGSGEDITHWAMFATWSPDGQKLGMVVAIKEPIILSSYISVWEWSTQSIKILQDEFQYVNDMTWSPDNQTILFLAEVGVKEGKGLHALQLVNTNKMENYSAISTLYGEISPSILGGRLIWRKDGQYVYIIHSQLNHKPLYQLKVENPHFSVNE